MILHNARLSAYRRLAMKKWLLLFLAIVAAMWTACVAGDLVTQKVDAQPEDVEPVKKPVMQAEQPKEPEIEKEKTPEEKAKPIEKKAVEAQEAACKSFFDKSLHASGEGMRYWYEEAGGFMEQTGIPYEKLGCSHCHADSCDKCHKDEKDGVPVFSVKKSRDEKTCLKCHARAGAARMFDQKMDVKDVHSAAGLSCVDCHSDQDIHGDGKKYKSMRDPGAVKVTCTSGSCHDNLNLKIRPHSAHKKAKIHCNACHVSSTISCLNCHFDSFIREKKKEGNFLPTKSWTLLVNHEGWVTTGNAQTLVSEGKKFVAYAPYFTHSVIKQGRVCKDCHGTDTAKKIVKGTSIEMASFQGGKLTHFKGVVPLVPELLKWPWLEKDESGTWKEVKNNNKPVVQQAAGAKPFTESQLKKLQAPFKK